MTKSNSVYICQQCDYESPKWMGQCNECKAWNSMIETAIEHTPKGFGGRSGTTNKAYKKVSLKKLSEVAAAKVSRVTTGIGELDRVLGGGIVPGSLTLVAGSPGVGKSSLLTVVVSHLRGLYVLGEESPQQVKLRVIRLGLRTDFEVLAETQAEVIASSIVTQSLVVVDSIQTLWSERLTGVAGSVGQIRESAQILLTRAKSTQVPIFLVGHVTKEGAVAGPKILEHLVDTVLQFEGDGTHEYRLLRAIKNRFGPTDEVGVFAMQDKGLVEIKNPSQLFLNSENSERKMPPGGVVVVVMQGMRPVLVEIQALVNPTKLAFPRRVGSGISERRLQIICAILQKHAGLNLSESDVFVNVAGGLTLKEPAADLGICLSIASSYKNVSLPQDMAVIGEVGLLGEVRNVSFLDRRIKEAKSQGFTKIISSKDYLQIHEAVRIIKGR